VLIFRIEGVDQNVVTGEEIAKAAVRWAGQIRTSCGPARLVAPRAVRPA